MVKLSINDIEVSFDDAIYKEGKIIILRTPAPVENYKYEDLKKLMTGIKLLTGIKEVIAVPKHNKIMYTIDENDTITELSLNIIDNFDKAED